MGPRLNLLKFINGTYVLQTYYSGNTQFPTTVN